MVVLALQTKTYSWCGMTLNGVLHYYIQDNHILSTKPIYKVYAHYPYTLHIVAGSMWSLACWDLMFCVS